MKIKTSELIGAALDSAVAECEGYDINIRTELSTPYIQANYVKDYHYPEGVFATYYPSTNWAQGGPIIEREKILADFDNGWSFETPWRCAVSINRYDLYDGETLLVAAMRCYVASKLGDVVDIPEELL